MAAPTTMTAYVGKKPGDIQIDTIERPKLERPTDILVQVYACATNPVDSKALYINPTPRTIGYDASGVITEVGAEVKNFKKGDVVWYSGDLNRAGSFAEYHVVDSRIASLKPKNLSHTEAAAFPLVAITAWEALHENMKVESGKSIFIFPGAGGVGSIAIQLAKIAGLKVITSASRPESVEWAKKMGADEVIDHSKDFEAEFKAKNIQPVNYVFNTYSDESIPKFTKILAPRAHICNINGGAGLTKEQLQPFFFARITLSWELMFSRPMLQYEEEEQGKILAKVAKLVEEHKVHPIHHTVLNGLASLPEATKLQTSGKAIGKIVIELVK